jgi:hypothetical protein
MSDSLSLLPLLHACKKGVPLQARCGPECSRRFRLPDFMTFGTCGEVVSLTHRPPLPPGMFLVLIFTGEWVNPRAIVWSEGNMSLKNPVTPPGIDPGTIQLVAQRLNHYATPGPVTCMYLRINNWTYTVRSKGSRTEFFTAFLPTPSTGPWLNYVVETVSHKSANWC